MMASGHLVSLPSLSTDMRMWQWMGAKTFVLRICRFCTGTMSRLEFESPVSTINHEVVDKSEPRLRLTAKGYVMATGPATTSHRSGTGNYCSGLATRS